jgi:aminoglycoside phosphotransferase family enzyme/predicted kinase
VICDSQKKVVDFLSSPKSYEGSPVQQIDTHLSHIFLTGDRAYKVKRAVRYDFVDFSRTALRKAACEKEVEINRRTAPEIYLGVVPIYSNDGGIAWRGEGPPVDWAVEMARFDTKKQLDALVSRGQLEVCTIKTLADVIAEFHRSAVVVNDFKPGGGVPAVLDQISTALHEHDIGTKRERDIARWTTLAFEEFEEHAKFLEARRRHSWVRHCHGDLHLANICLYKGHPTPFDAIEFNDDLANIDVLYDLAFTLMDLVHHNQSELANTLLNRYLSITRDYSGVRLLPLFQSMRAGVRAMVLSLPTQSDKNKRMAERYLDLALEYLIGDHNPRLIAVGGYSATGKSTLAGALAMRLNGRCGAVMLRSDVIRKRLLDQNPEEPLSADGYGEAPSAAVYERLTKDARRTLRAGQSVVLDATFLNQTFRNAAEYVAASTGVPFNGLWLSAPREILVERVSARLNGASDATASVLERQLERNIDPGSWRVVDASGTAADTLRDATDAVDFEG